MWQCDALRTSRRSFLERVGVAVALAGTSCAGPLTTHTRGVAHSAKLQPIGRGWDMSWIDAPGSATYRAAFDAKAIANGVVLGLAARSMNEFAQVYGARDGELGVVIVMRVEGLALAFGDATWGRYQLGAEYEITDPETNRPTLRNPFYRPATAATPDEVAGSLEALRRRGATFLVCDVALGHAAARFATATNRKPEDVKTELRDDFVPGAVLVPSGIFALIRAQNAGWALVDI